jgi:hypothetical protein
MRFATIALMLFMSLILFSSDSRAAVDGTTQYVAVAEPFVNVYKDLDPRSMVIGTVHKGDHLELISSGDSWYKVKYRESEGWLEKRAGDVVNSSSSSSGVIIIAVLLLVAVVFGGVAFYIYKSKMSEAA